MNLRRDRPASLGAWSAQLLRRLLGWPGLAVIPLALAALISLSGSAESNFSVSAHTEVVAVEPSCALTLNWTLAAGSLSWIRHDGAEAASPACQPLELGKDSIELTLRAGARAVMEQVEHGQWQVSVTRSDTFAACSSDAGGGRPVFEASFGACRLFARRTTGQATGNDGCTCIGEADGLTWRSGKPGPDPRPQEFTHLLEGRIVVGAPVLDTGGWMGTTTALREARIQARIKAAVTQQSISVLDEAIEPGSIIDTTPSPGPEAPSARGFVRPHPDGGLNVLAHVTSRHVGVTPHAGERRDVSVSRWSQLLVSPFLQALLVAFGVVAWAAQALINADTLRDTTEKLDKERDKNHRRAAWSRRRRRTP